MTLSNFYFRGYLIFIVFFMLSTSALAESKSHGMGHGPDHSMMEHHEKSGHHDKGEHHGQGKGMHLFGTHWRSTLTDKQRADIDKLHLELMKVHAPIKAKIKVLKTELALLVIAENPNMKTIDAKIDELMKLKKDKMRSKYAHKVEMRKVLTPEQRVSFDMGILQKALDGERKKGH